MMDGNAPAKRGRGRAAIGLATALLAKLNDEVKKGQKVAIQRKPSAMSFMSTRLAWTAASRSSEPMRSASVA
jgi:hypothetical protein